MVVKGEIWMRWFLIIFWISAIFVFTCTSSFNGLIESGLIHFTWNGKPLFSELLLPLPEKLSTNFLLQKSGHFLAFFILAILLQSRFRSKFFGLTFAASYAMLTEILQLYFNRGGRLFDIGFDIVGILFAMAIGSLFTNKNTVTTKASPYGEVG
jgi:VanZ family protein